MSRAAAAGAGAGGTATAGKPAPGRDARATELLLAVSEAAGGTLDLDELLRRVAECVRRVIDYEIFAILLVSDRAPVMKIRFAVGHLPEVVESVRVAVGEGITGAAAAALQPQLVNDVAADPRYIHAVPGVRSELAVPILWNRRAIGVMDVQSPRRDAFTPEHRDALVLIAARIAQGVENAKLYRNAVSRERTLELLNDISREMTSILSLDELLTRTAEMVRRVIDFHLFSVLLLNERGDKLEHRLSVKLGENIRIKHDIPLDQGVVGAAARAGQPVLVRDVTADPRYIALNPEARCELAVPLVYQGRVIGVLDLEHAKKGYFTERHARTLATLAAQMAIAIVNARLYERVARAERRMERDLRLAQEMQRHLLPPACPTVPGLEIAARSAPARELGGDLFDFLPYGKGRLGIAVGDVAGKGAGAALYGAVVSGILRSLAASAPDPGDLLGAINAALLGRRIEAQFVTLLFALWRARERRVVVANSGLPYPLLVSGENCRAVEVAGLPLGMLEGGRYETAAATLAPGDLLVFASDGITEFENAGGEDYGRRRLEAVLRRERERSCEAIVAAIFADLERFGGGASAADDRTVVVMRAAGDGGDK